MYCTLFPALSFNVTFSAMVVVALSGPAGWPFSAPNFNHFCLSATAWSTTDFCSVRFVRRVTLTFFPSSFRIYSTVVRIPFSSTESSILEGSVPRSILQVNYQSITCLTKFIDIISPGCLIQSKKSLSVRLSVLKMNVLSGRWSHFGGMNYCSPTFFGMCTVSHGTPSAQMPNWALQHVVFSSSEWKVDILKFITDLWKSQE